MNEVFESEKMVVHDDRVFITAEKAADILIDSGYVYINEPPNFSTENEWDVFDSPRLINWVDCVSNEMHKNLNRFTDEQIKKSVVRYLTGLEITEVN